MSKKYKGKICVYCASNPSTTGDHVFARAFFSEVQRADLPQVPACARCNKAKSDLEHYLATVMPFGGVHPAASSMLQEDVPGRLAHNVKLHKELAQAIEYANIDGASGEKAMLIPFATQKLHDLFNYVTKGLVWHHWGVLLDERHGVRTMSITDFGVSLLAPLFSKNANQRVSESPGNGTFRYEGAQGVDYPEFSFWSFSVYGGLKLSGEPRAPNQSSTALYSFTARKEFYDKPVWKALFS
jgi:hypothetical protein